MADFNMVVYYPIQLSNEDLVGSVSRGGGGGGGGCCTMEVGKSGK